MIEAFIFDLDGTLLDSEILWVEAIELYLREHWPTVERDYVMKLVYGRSWSDIYTDICHASTDIDLSIDEMQEALTPYFKRLTAKTDIRIEGSVGLLRRLAVDYPVCIVSGSPGDEIEDGIELMGIESLLAFYLGAEDYAPGKPDPACFLKAAVRLDVPPERCLVFEDSSAGVVAARRAGMFCVALARPGRPAQDIAGAHLVCEDLAEFDVPAFEAAYGSRGRHKGN